MASFHENRPGEILLETAADVVPQVLAQVRPQLGRRIRGWLTSGARVPITSPLEKNPPREDEVRSWETSSRSAERRCASTRSASC